MNSFFLDASALAKRFCAEIGSDRVDHLFSLVASARLACLALGAAEVVSALVRRRNASRLTPASFGTALLNLKAEVIDAPGFRTLETDNSLIAAAIPLIIAHSINTSDAVALQSALLLATPVRANGDDWVFMASDQRLLRAAKAEGLVTFDPETQSQADLDKLIGP